MKTKEGQLVAIPKKSRNHFRENRVTAAILIYMEISQVKMSDN